MSVASSDNKLIRAATKGIASSQSPKKISQQEPKQVSRAELRRNATDAISNAVRDAQPEVDRPNTNVERPRVKMSPEAARDLYNRIMGYTYDLGNASVRRPKQHPALYSDGISLKDNGVEYTDIDEGLFDGRSFMRDVPVIEDAFERTNQIPFEALDYDSVEAAAADPLRTVKNVNYQKQLERQVLLGLRDKLEKMGLL